MTPQYHRSHLELFAVDEGREVLVKPHVVRELDRVLARPAREIGRLAHLTDVTDVTDVTEAARSAALPTSIVPMLSARPSAAAAWRVTPRSASSGVMRNREHAAAKRRGGASGWGSAWQEGAARHVSGHNNAPRRVASATSLGCNGCNG